MRQRKEVKGVFLEQWQKKIYIYSGSIRHFPAAEAGFTDEER